MELEEFIKRFESVNVCLWSLGFIDEIDSTNKCNIEKSNDIIFSYNTYQDFFNSSRLRKKEEILLKADLVARYYWAFRQAELEKISSKLNGIVADIQNETFEFITSYSYDSLSNKNFIIDYSKGDLNFTFEKPAELDFEKLSNNLKEIFALKSNNSRSKIAAFDLGKINIIEFNEMVNKNIDMFRNNGFDILNNYEMHSSALKEKIIHIIVRGEDFHLIHIIYIFLII